MLRLLLIVALALTAVRDGRSHEAERTRVVLTLQTDGRFTLEVSHDPTWLLLRLETFAGGAVPPNITPAQRDHRLAQLTDVFADRVVLFVDAHEVRADHVQYLSVSSASSAAGASASSAADASAPSAAYRLTGTMPRDATRLRWLYGLVADPYPLEIRQPDGSSTLEWIEGTNWSGVIDLTTSFTRPTRAEIVRQYMWLGYTHILPKGLDHILFVIGLFLLSRSWRPLLLQVTAFTIAHSITLGLSIYGVVSLSPRIVEPLIALSIVYVAVENLFTKELRPWRVALVFMFGLLHGLGFAGVLQDLGLPRDEFLTALLTFNLGVEGGQLTIIGTAILLTMPIAHRSWYHRRVVIPASLAIAGVGLYWTLVRAAAATNF